MIASRSACQCRLGITLVEVAVVALLAFTALGLVLMVMLRGREDGLRLHCLNNLKQIGSATHVFSDLSAGPKGGEGPVRPYLPAARIAEGYATWAVQIAPMLSNEKKLADWDLRLPYSSQPASVRQTRLPVYICPARAPYRGSFLSPADGGDAAGSVGDYAGVAGNGDPEHLWTGPDANGPIILGRVVKREGDLILEWTGRTGFDDLSRGLSHTVLVGEKHVPIGRLNDPDVGDGSIYDGTGAANASRVGGPGYGLAEAPDAPFHANFGSYHPGIVQFVFADNSAKARAVDIDEAVLGQMTTRGD